MAAITAGNAYVDTDLGTNDTSHGESAGAGACQSLAYILASRITTLTGALTVHYKGATAGTTGATISGHGTTATNRLTIQVDAADRPSSMVWDSGKPRLTPASGSGIIIDEEYVNVIGLQVSVGGAASANAIEIAALGNDNAIRLDHLILKGENNSGDHSFCGIKLADSNPYADVTVFNTLIYDFYLRDFPNTAINYASGIYDDGARTLNLYNVTIHNCSKGIHSNNYGTSTLKNALIKCNGVNANFVDMSGTFDSVTYSATSDATIPAGTGNRASQAFTFENEAGDNFLLAAADAGGLDHGVTDPGAGLFSDDITGVTRTGTWDIGAFERAAAGGGFKSCWARGSNGILGVHQ